jgi:hypothetical protein
MEKITFTINKMVEIENNLLEKDLMIISKSIDLLPL